MLNAHSRYFAPTKPMAPGTRTPNARILPDDYAGLPRDLNTELATETVAKLGAVFLPADNRQNHGQTPKQKAPE
jgi:hypothetical protein